jgi:hypothetical protein
MIIYLDIETAPNPAMRQYVTTNASEAPKHWKDQAIIAKWVTDEQARRVGRMALDVDHARIVALSFAAEDGDPTTMVAKGEQLEADLLRTFWGMGRFAGVQRIRYCGYNILNFDLPLIIRRSWVLGVQARQVDMRRYSSEGVIDLMQLLYHWGNGPGPRSRSLKAVCEMYGIPNPLPDLDGSKVADMDDDTLAAYCRNDVEMTRALAQKMRGWYWK